MKASAALALFVAASLGACSHTDLASDAGNPNHMAYVGAPGSVYDPALNPPKDIGHVAYDPNQPLENNLAYDERLPRPTPDGTPVAAEATLVPRQSRHPFLFALMA